MFNVDKLKKHVLPIGVLLYFILSIAFDLVDKYSIYYEYDLVKFNRILKLVYLIFISVLIFYHRKKMLSTHLVSLITLLGISIIFILKFNFSPFYIDEFARYFFGFLMLPWLFISFNSKGFNFFYGFYRIMRAVVYINIVLVVLGLIFKINLFETYEFSRFGYNGALISQGSTPYIYLTATALFWVYRDKMLLFLRTNLE